MGNSVKVGTASFVELDVDTLFFACLSSIGRCGSSLGDHAMLFSIWILDAALGAELGY